MTQFLQCYAPELSRRCRSELRKTNRSVGLRCEHDNEMPNVRKRIGVLERAILPIQYLPADDSRSLGCTSSELVQALRERAGM